MFAIIVPMARVDSLVQRCLCLDANRTAASDKTRGSAVYMQVELAMPMRNGKHIGFIALRVLILSVI